MASSPSGFTPPARVSSSASSSKCSCFSKSLIVLLILLAIPLFPSQAPDFISDTILTQFWEIFHLLFIGIAVSYGLFATKTPNANANTVSSRNYYATNTSHEYNMSDDIASFSSIFENNEGGNSDNQCFLDRDGESVVVESKKIRSLVSKSSLVVVSNGSSDFRPLNLPVRSLRSSVVENVENDDGFVVGMRNRGGVGSKRFAVKGVDDDHDAKVVKIRGVVPKNLEKKFEEVAGASVIPWRSRSVKMEKGVEEVGGFRQTAHCRPQSVGDIELESLGSRQIAHSRPQSVGEMELESLGSRQIAHSRPQSVGEMELESLGSRSLQDSQGLGSLKVENGRTKWDFWKPVDSVSQQKEQGLLNVKTSLNGAKSRVYSISSAATEMNRMNDLKCNLKDNGDLGDGSGVEEKGKRGIELLGSDVKSPRLARVLSRAKSVRTIKPNKYTGDSKDASSNRAGFSVKKDEQTELEDSHANHRNQEFDRVFPMPKPKPILHDEEKDDIDHRSFTDSEEERSEFDKSFDEDDVESYLASDAELGSEVDRKAGEFIAKFKEQIRLQKSSSSVKGYNGW